MYRANIPLIIWYKVFKEAFTIATLLDGFMPIEIDNKVAAQYVHFH
jgi:hypothetical protein